MTFLGMFLYIHAYELLPSLVYLCALETYINGITEYMFHWNLFLLLNTMIFIFSHMA